MKIVIEVPEGSTVTIAGPATIEVPAGSVVSHPKQKSFSKYYLEWVCECGHSENKHRWHSSSRGPNTLADCSKCLGPNGFACKEFRKAGPLDIKQAEHELAWIKYMASL